MPSGIYQRTEYHLKICRKNQKKATETNRGRIRLDMLGDNNPAKKPEIRKKISEANRGRIGSNLGKKFTEEHKSKISEAQREEKAWRWKGDDVGYMALHDWVRRQLGRPKKCEHCGTTTAKKFEWANKSGHYLRKTEDWFRLCTKCHIKFDKLKNNNKK